MEIEKKIQRNDAYWLQRQAKALDKLTDKGIAETQALLADNFRRTMKKVLGQFEKTYIEVISNIDEGSNPTPADLYKLDRYWKLQAQLTNELSALGDKESKILSKQFMAQYETIYKALSLESDASFSQISTQGAQQIINQIWCADGKSWSQRLWKNTNMLQEKLNQSLVHSIIAGENPSVLKKQLMADFDVSFNQANTIVRTEMAHIQTETARQRYRNYGIEEVEVKIESGACEVCQELFGKTGNRKRFNVNGNIPVPAHPNCRCCIIPVVDLKALSLNRGQTLNNN